jgi:hypothetical protein
VDPEGREVAEVAGFGDPPHALEQRLERLPLEGPVVDERVGRVGLPDGGIA